MNAVSVHRDLGEGRVGRGGVAVVVRVEVVGIVSMVCRLNLLHVASVQAFKSSFGNMQLSYDWSIWVVDFWAAVVVMNLVIVMLSLLPAASFLQVSVVFVGVSRAQEQGTGRSPSPFPVERVNFVRFLPGN